MPHLLPPHRGPGPRAGFSRQGPAGSGGREPERAGKRHQDELDSDSPKRAKGNSGFGLPTDSAPKTDIPDASDAEVESRDSTNIKSDTVSIESIARHIATHLQGLSFLTTRLITAHGHDDAEMESQGSSADTGVSSSSSLFRALAGSDARETAVMSVTSDADPTTGEEVDMDYELPIEAGESGPAVQWDDIRPDKHLPTPQDDHILQNFMKRQLENSSSMASEELGSPLKSAFGGKRGKNRSFVSFSTISAGTWTRNTPAYVIKRDHGEYRYTQTSRTLLIVAEPYTTKSLLPWSLGKFVHDHDEVVILYYDKGIGSLAPDSPFPYQRRTSELMELALSMNTCQRTLRIVVEWAPGTAPFHEGVSLYGKFSRMLPIFSSGLFAPHCERQYSCLARHILTHTLLKISARGLRAQSSYCWSPRIPLQNRVGKHLFYALACPCRGSSAQRRT